MRSASSMMYRSISTIEITSPVGDPWSEVLSFLLGRGNKVNCEGGDEGRRSTTDMRRKSGRRGARRNFLSCGHEASTWTQAGALRLCAPRGAATARRQNFPSSKQRFSDEDSQLV